MQTFDETSANAQVSPSAPVKSIGWQVDPDPTMRSLNPFTQARNVAGLHQGEIASALGVDVNEIIRLEQAIYERVPRRIVDHYMSELNLPPVWPVAYRRFQRMLRVSASRPIHGVWQMPFGELTFRRWRVHNWPTMSQTGWCKSFCIHPASLYAIERGEKSAVPSQILTALIEANIFNEEQARSFAARIRQAANARG